MPVLNRKRPVDPTPTWFRRPSDTPARHHHDPGRGCASSSIAGATNENHTMRIPVDEVGSLNCDRSDNDLPPIRQICASSSLFQQPARREPRVTLMTALIARTPKRRSTLNITKRDADSVAEGCGTRLARGRDETRNVTSLLGLISHGFTQFLKEP